MKRYTQWTLGLVLGTVLIVAPAISYAGSKGGGGGHRGGGGSRGHGGGSHGRSMGQRSFSRNSLGNHRTFSSGQLNSPRHLPAVRNSQTIPNGSLANRLSRNPGTLVGKQLTPTRFNGALDAIKGSKPGNLPGLKNDLTPMKFPRDRVGDFAKHMGSDRTRGDVDRYRHRAPHNHVTRHRHAHWWLRFACGVHHYHHRPWVCYDGYWSCWRPCSYNYVRCHGYDYSYFVGMECVAIPDVYCLGVESVLPESPAAYAGLQTGDVIVSVNGKSPTSEDVITQELPTERLALEVLRDGASSPTLITLVPKRVEVGPL